MKEYGLSRIERFEKEKSLLKPLPQNSFEICEWRQAKVHPDCHIQVERNCYSVPYTYVGRIVRVKTSSRLIEVFDLENQNLLATHIRCEGKFKTSTNDVHYPEPKVAIARFEVKFAKNEADKMSPNTRTLVDRLLDCSHPLKYLRRVQGILRFAQKKSASTAAIEHAAHMAIQFNKLNLHYLQAAALHFEHHGKRPKFVAPQRNESELYLHEPIHNKKGNP